MRLHVSFLIWVPIVSWKTTNSLFCKELGEKVFMSKINYKLNRVSEEGYTISNHKQNTINFDKSPEFY
jgi:hypothetical protein